MKGFRKNNKGLVICAVDFGPGTDAVLKTGISFAKQMGWRVEAVNVVTPIPTDLAGLDHPLYAPYPPLNQAIEEEIIADRQSSMEELVKRWEGRIDAGTVRLGAVADEILALVVEKDADVIFTGISPRNFYRNLGGLSTAATLMRSSGVPVFAVPSGHTLDFQTIGLRLLVLDDLRDETLSAVNWTAELCKHLENPHLRLTHVVGSSEGAITRGLARAWGSLGHGPIEPSEIEAYALEKLTKRMPVTNLINVECEIKTGDIRDEVLRAAHDHQADLLLFGRHHFIHQHPFHIGRMPLKAMLEGDRVVGIIPAAATS